MNVPKILVIFPHGKLQQVQKVKVEPGRQSVNCVGVLRGLDSGYHVPGWCSVHFNESCSQGAYTEKCSFFSSY